MVIQQSLNELTFAVKSCAISRTSPSICERRSQVLAICWQIATKGALQGSRDAFSFGNYVQRVKLCTLKIIGKEFQKNSYKTIFRKINTKEIFFQLTLITNKDYF